jgi:hypothetical protein
MKKNFIFLSAALAVVIISLVSCQTRKCWTCSTEVTDGEYAGNTPVHIIHHNDTIMCDISKANVNSYQAAHTYTLTGSNGKANYIEYTNCH